MGCGNSKIQTEESSDSKSKINNQLIQNQQINKNTEIKKKEINLNREISYFEQNNKDKPKKENYIIEKNNSIETKKESNNKGVLNIIKKESKNVANNISFKCIYDIKDHNYTQIINNQYLDYINEEIESKIKILINNKKENIVFQKKFDKLGITEIKFD